MCFQLMTNLGWETGTDEIKQAVGYLKETGSAKVGIIGKIMFKSTVVRK